MARWNPLARSYDVKCPDGTVKTVYKNVKDAFPLAIEGYETNMSAKLQKELDSASLDAAVKKKVDGLLFGLDDINSGLMISFRTAYVAFQSDPCSNGQFLINQIEKLNEEQRRLRALKMQIRGYVDLVNSENSGNTVLLADRYNELVSRIGSTTMKKEMVSEAIAESAEAAAKMIGEGDER